MMAISLGSHPAHWLWCISGRAARRCGDPGLNIITRNMNLKLIQAHKLQDTRFSHPQKPVLTTMDSKVKAPVTLRTFLSRSGGSSWSLFPSYANNIGHYSASPYSTLYSPNASMLYMRPTITWSYLHPPEVVKPWSWNWPSAGSSMF